MAAGVTSVKWVQGGKYFPCYTRLIWRKNWLQSRSFRSLSVSMACKVLVPVANGTEPIEAVVQIDVLRRAGADVIVASVEKELHISACWGLKLVADALIKDCVDTKFDLISLPGGIPGSTSLGSCGALESIVKKHAAEGRAYGAICAAPATALGPWGLLNGLQVTSHPSWMPKLPLEAKGVESRVVQDGQVVTSRAPGTTMEYALALVEKLHGKEKADEVAKPMVMHPHSGVHTFRELNSVEWKCKEMPKILVPIANGSEEMEAVMIIDILRRAGAEVVVASVDDTLEVLASRKVKLVADMFLDEALMHSYDLVVLPGGLNGASKFAGSTNLIDLLKKQKESGKPYAAICASPALVLEPHGLLKEKKATAYPSLCKDLTDQTEADNRVVIDGSLATSRGPGTAMEFSFAIVEKFFGREKSFELAKTLFF